MNRAQSIDFTVAIPTYNGGDRIPQVLANLKQQIYPENLSWEIIIINNNSNEETTILLEEIKKEWNFPIPINLYFEEKQGIAFARQKAVENAQGELIAFIDDDNFPDRNWLQAAYQFGKNNPKVGVFSGKIKGEFEIQPPENFSRIQSFLALREHGETPHPFDPHTLKLPPGAGLVIRKQAWLESMPQKMIYTSLGGDDYEISLYLYQKGWEIWYNPEMKMKHYIPAQRLQKDYLLPLSHRYGLRCCKLRLILVQPWQKPIVLLKIVLGSLKRWLNHWLTYKGQVKKDWVLACEREFYWASAMGPFYLWKNN